jgi:hypothetical protein
VSGQRLKGGPELLDFLAAFPKRLQQNALRSAMIAGARVIRDEARANVPISSGAVRATIKTSSPRAFAGDYASVKVKLLGYESYIGYFLEYGVARHFVSPGDSKYHVKTLNRRTALAGAEKQANGMIKVKGSTYVRTFQTTDGPDVRVLKISSHFVGGAILHPGFVPRPFLRPALDRKADEAVAAIGARLREYLKDKTGFTAPDTIEPDEVEE